MAIDYELEAGPHAPGELMVLDWEAEEELSRPFVLDVTTVVHKDTSLDEAGLLGQPATLTMRAGHAGDRFLHGVVAAVRSWEEGRGELNRRVRLRVVPDLWRLGQARNCRIFQNKTVPAIVHEVLDGWKVKHAFGAKRAKGTDGLAGSYPKREYVVQYAESDLDFVARLLEEAGAFYFFEHEQGAHTLVIADENGACQDLPGDPKVPFKESTGMGASGDVIDAFSARLEVRTGAVALRDYNFEKPTLDLTAQKKAGKDDDLEAYEYPGGYLEKGDGGTLAGVRLEERRVRAEVMSGSAPSRRLAPGLQLELEGHPVQSLDDRYLVLSTRHVGKQPEVLRATLPEGRWESYRCSFEAIRAVVPFRPARRTERALMPGPQTAVVVGPSGEEIHTDKYGRIKVQFHWDRKGKKDDTASCWMRVSQAWAGPGWGALYLPRIGQEVVVEFLEGDPDRPIVSGAVYNGVNPPPYPLPGEKTKSTLKSESSIGGEGSNELRFEDAKGSEEVYLHAQKDLLIVVENDKDQKVHGNEALAVDQDRARTITGNQSLDVGKNDTTTVGGDQALTVTGNRVTSVSGNHSETVSGDQFVDVGMAHTLTVALASAETVGLAKALTVGGAYAVTVGAAMNEAVGGAKAEEVGGAKVEVVGGKRTERVAGSKTVNVSKDLSEQVGGKRSLTVGKDAAVSVGGKMSQTVKEACTVKAKEITLTAAEKVIFKVGSATIEFKKNGDISVKGGKIDVKASGNLTLKGSKIAQN